MKIYNFQDDGSTFATFLNLTDVSVSMQKLDTIITPVSVCTVSKKQLVKALKDFSGIRVRVPKGTSERNIQTLTNAGWKVIARMGDDDYINKLEKHQEVFYYLEKN